MSDYIVGSRAPKPGDEVFVIQKKNYGTENYDLGIVKDVLTSQKFHPRGHKVRLKNGVIGRVQKFADDPEATPRQPKYDKGEEFNAQSNPTNYSTSPDDLV